MDVSLFFGTFLFICLQLWKFWAFNRIQPKSTTRYISRKIDFTRLFIRSLSLSHSRALFTSHCHPSLFRFDKIRCDIYLMHIILNYFRILMCTFRANLQFSYVLGRCVCVNGVDKILKATFQCSFLYFLLPTSLYTHSYTHVLMWRLNSFFSW